MLDVVTLFLQCLRNNIAVKEKFRNGRKKETIKNRRKKVDSRNMTEHVGDKKCVLIKFPWLVIKLNITDLDVKQKGQRN